MGRYDVPHRFVNGRCARCAMLSTWEGARYSCTGIAGQDPVLRQARERSRKRRVRDRLRRGVA